MRPKQNWHKWLVLFGLALSARTIACDYSTITDKFGTEAVEMCNEKCPFQNRTGDSNFDLSCGPDCSIQQCALGCSLWKQGLEQTCQITCNVTSETVVSRELYCVMGCNEALNTYFQKLRDLIGVPPSPALVADSLTATALSLLWEAPHLANLSYLAQWRYEELTDSWQYCTNHSRPERSIVHVDNLRPYTKYRFRIAIFLSARGGTVEPVYSAQSVVISTLENGKPSSPPSSLRAVALDDSRVSISWKPGPFPNGPLISYVLRLADTQPNSYTALEDMPASNNTLFYMFQNLSPAREYEVSVAMRNAVGEGPRAMLRVSTPPSPTVVPSQQPILILGGEQSVFAAQANDMLSDPMELYTTEFNISGVGIDVSRDYLFVSTSNGYVYRSSLSKKSKSVPILTPDSISYKPLELSVDWLNKHLYILGEVYYTKEGTYWPNTTKYSNWEIQRCDFDGKNQLVALAGFNSRPIHFEVDPYNGYIFWALRGVERGGLYRLDLANISNGVHHDAPPELILRDAHLGAFTVDHTDFRLLVANRRQNRTVLAVSLDGREVNDLRRNTQTPMFELVRSMAFAGGLFYWTNGKEMLTEEYHAETDSYYHNEFHVVFNTKRVATRQVLVALRSCQPIPVPVNPPIGVQSVMGVDKAKVSWSVPHLLGHQGSGAWQQWAYHLQLTDASTGDVIERKNINGTTFKVENLKENTKYIVKVAASTESGSGPWSSEFVGSTLPSTETTLQSTLLWSGPDGLLQTDLTGDNMKTLIHSSHLKNLLITDISWYRDKLYLVTNMSSVLWYNTTSHEKGLMMNMDHVGSLAVDWVGKRIYWSNPKQQLITRGNLDGGNREPVPIVTVAKELVIDSLSAYIYWNTGHAVEAARLNGENKMVYYPAQLFSGKQVMGITADLENKWLYWIVRSYDGSELHRAPTADTITTEYDVSQSTVTRLSGASSLSSLRYFSGRLAWVRDTARAVLSDSTGRYCAELPPRVRAIAVREPTLHRRSVDLVAVPEAINKSSISVSGVWDKFNVSWSPAEHVNHGRVFYDVSLHFHGYYKIEKTLEHPWVLVRERTVPPYSALEASVRAHTAWGAGAASSVALRTPQAAPAAPRSPRVFLVHKHNGAKDAIFRWDPPVRSNGVILSFETKCWTTLQGSLVTPASCGLSHLPRDYHQQLLTNLLPNTTYNFKVRAYTEAGFGFYSETVSCSSDDINPVPKILMSSQEFIKLMDLDNGEIMTVPKIIGMPIDFGVSIEEKEIYWSNNLEEIFASHFFGNGHYKLSTTNGSSSSVAVDWVGRAVYWAQHEPTSALPHAVYRAVLGLPQSRSRCKWVLSTKRPVYNLQVSPLTRSLYWYEASEHAGLGTLMMSNTDGTNITPFFNRSRETNCDCPSNPQVARPFVLDVSGPKKEIYWVDPRVQQIVASDIRGCHCRIIVDAKYSAQLGFPPVSITVDSRNIYWFNSTEKYVYYRDKYKLAKVNQIKTVFGSKILALDSSNQPYPPLECLLPKADNLEPQIVTNSANSLTIELPIVNNSKECHSIATAATEYTIYYQLDTNNGSEEPIMAVSTVDKEVVLSNLLTFTNYTVHIEATNFYAKRYGVPPLKSSEVVLQTAAEAPSAAEDLTATVLSPVLARVEWGARPDVWYQLYWATNQSDHSQHKFQEHNTFPVSEGRAANMSHLSPNTSYVVWVRACSNYSKVYTDSQHISVHTYPLPSRIFEYNVTAYSILVKWNPPTDYNPVSYNVEYTDSTTRWWSCSQSVIPHVWSAAALRPRTPYRFRLRLQYTARAPPYYWPHDDRFTFVTLGDVPAAPGMPRVQAVDSRVLRAWWSEPSPHGHPVTLYRVWGRAGHGIIDISDNATENIIDQTNQNLPDDIDEDFRSTIIKEGLVLLHNGTDNYWLISSEAASDRAGGWRVSVQARNELGWGPLSPPAELRVPPAAAPPAAAAALLTAAAALAALAAAVAAAMFYVYKNRLKKKKAALQSSHLNNVIRRGPDVELATLRQLPIRHSNNILYNQGIHIPSDAEVAALPHISREQITLHKFLGSGAFGEVFEGVARNLHGARENTKVAVKTLRKGASEQEKTEFLQEAALMSNFKHEHILRLLGVCLDNDPHYIIMELMEGGDLLSYLRAKRSSLYSRESLTLRELLSMCVDVTQGCRYLEEMHFVHRDLAARNCLVATRAGIRVVKIGDFGLARDIYRNDYYRKAGEGLLPVRWMAVECLVDGVFSCQSDVWAWAVLCWEVLSLGQQPYPARTNRQVLAYVRAGGSPDRPPNCPSALYDLLQQCWSYVAEQRPTFKHCLEVVTALRDNTSHNITLSAVTHPPHYLTLIPSELAVDNRTYLLDENDNACIEARHVSLYLPSEEDVPEVMEPSRLLPGVTPKYLELMYDSDSVAGTGGDGYEVPRSPASPPAQLLSRRSTGEYTRRSPHRPCYRSLSLRQPRPANATIVPLRNGIAKRASLCDSLHGPFLLDSTEFQIERDIKTPL